MREVGSTYFSRKLCWYVSCRKKRISSLNILGQSWLCFWLLMQSCNSIWSSKGSSWQRSLGTSQLHKQNEIFSFQQKWMWDNLYLCALLSFLKFWSFWIFRSQSLQKYVWTVFVVLSKAAFSSCTCIQQSIPGSHHAFKVWLCHLEQAARDKWSKNLILKLKLPSRVACS